MSGLIGLLVFLLVLALVCGPLSLIVSLIALSRASAIERKLDRRRERPVEVPEPVVLPKPEAPSLPVVEPPPVEPPPVKPPVTTLWQDIRPAEQELTLEAKIGTQWVLVAGVICVIFTVGYFLKLAYDKGWITPVSQIIVGTAAGLAALALGEFTRRRGYGIVAKGVTAMGFAILYATVFAANRWHHLISSPPAYVLAGLVTIAAMAYAVGLDEVVAALLALIGGYFTPVIVSTGENLPIPLFTYVLILSGGAMLCAYWRRWIAVNIVAWIGTYVLYTGWFERFYRPVMEGAALPPQLGIALVGLTVFFLVFLILPILHGLRRRIASRPEDVVLIALNAAVVLYYLWMILGHNYRTALALCSLALGGVHLALAALAQVRCKEDVNLRQVLLVIGLAAVTLAVPLYWKRYAIPAALALEAVVLVVIGLRYRSRLIQVAAALVMVLAIGWLAYLWPLHRAPFRVILNPVFGAWCLTSAAILAGHLLYRFHRQADVALGPDVTISEVLYSVGLLLLLTALGAELWFHAHLNHGPLVLDDAFVRQMILVLPAFVLLFLVRPLCPRGPFCRIVGSLLAAVGAAYLVTEYPDLHFQPFPIFVNRDFTAALVQVVVLFAGAYLLRRSESAEGSRTPIRVPLGLCGIVLLWVLLTEEIWLFFHLGHEQTKWQWLAQMWISVMWAAYGMTLMIIGFWRNMRALRYLALTLFVLLLAKLFLWDMSTLQTAYRIAGFLATGLVLVAVSYLYQYLKKKGFFDKILIDTDKR